MSLYKGNNLISGAIPNSANQSLSNLNSAGQDIIDGKVDLDYSNADYQPVNKSGDTMTGGLTVSTADQDQIVLVEPQTTKGTNPSETYYTGIYFNDSQNLPQTSWRDTRLAYVEHGLTDTGVSVLSLGAVQNTANGVVGSFHVQVDSSGNASCSFPKTTCVDGQWVTLNQKVISSSTSLVGSSNLSYTVNVPNDGHYYEIIVEGQLRSNATANYWGSLQVNTSFGGFMIAQAKSETDKVNDTMTCVTIPLGTNRNLQVVRSNTSSNFNCACQQLTVKAYRRIGTNS